MYDSLVQKRLHGSFKQSIKSFVLNNDLLSKVYDKYHFYVLEDDDFCSDDEIEDD